MKNAQIMNNSLSIFGFKEQINQPIYRQRHHLQKQL